MNERNCSIGLHTKVTDENGLRLVSFVASKSMMVRNTMIPHKSIHKDTWTSPDGVTVKQIDYILIDCRHKNIIDDTISFGIGLKILGRIKRNK